MLGSNFFFCGSLAATTRTWSPVPTSCVSVSHIFIK